MAKSTKATSTSRSKSTTFDIAFMPVNQVTKTTSKSVTATARKKK